jgi:hypothetical protein
MPLVRPAHRTGLVALVTAAVIAACGAGSSERERAALDDGALDDSSAAQQAQLAPAECRLPAGGYGPSCDACLAARCCGPVADCLHDPTCRAQLSCVVDCQSASDPGGCSSACVGDRPHPGYLSYDDCSFDSCLSSCWM